MGKELTDEEKERINSQDQQDVEDVAEVSANGNS
jgi:hypothetical protein